MEQSDHDFSLIDRERDLPPDELYPALSACPDCGEDIGANDPHAPACPKGDDDA